MSIILVLYYSNRCGHCSDFLPIWNQFKNKMEKEKPHLNITDIECPNSKECNKPYILGVPTIVLHNNGQPTVYEGERTIEALEQFVSKL